MAESGTDPHLVVAELLPLADAAATLPADLHWLDPGEAERLACLRVEPRRLQYLAGHWLARRLLARLAGGHARDWQLQERPGLPPAVRGRPELRLGLSHSGDWLAGIVAAMPVGIDVEARPRAHGLAAAERLLLARGEAPGSLDGDALLQRWVAKEALLKRDCGSALPDQLARLGLLPAGRDDADVQVLSGSACHLALAVPAGCRLQLLGRPEPAQLCYWRAYAAEVD